MVLPPPQQFVATQAWSICVPQMAPAMVEVTGAPSCVATRLLQQKSMTVGGLVGRGVPHWMTAGVVEHNKVGGEGTKLTICVQTVLLLPQQSIAFQTKETDPAQPEELVLLPIRLTCTALQHADVAVGGTGGTGIGPPQGMV